MLLKRERMMLKPSLKDKKRYVVVRIFPVREYNLEDIIAEIWKVAYYYGGYIFVSRSNMNILKNLYYPEKGIFVISVNPKYVEDMRMILMSVNKIKDEPVSLLVEGVSGTIKSAKKKFIEGG